MSFGWRSKPAVFLPNRLQNFPATPASAPGLLFYFVGNTHYMAYHSRNHQKTVELIIRLYLRVKEHDVADSHIVRNIFPKHGVHISYRTWMLYKRRKVSAATVATNGTNPQLGLAL